MASQFIPVRFVDPENFAIHEAEIARQLAGAGFDHAATDAIIADFKARISCVAFSADLSIATAPEFQDAARGLAAQWSASAAGMFREVMHAMFVATVELYVVRHIDRAFTMPSDRADG